MLGAGAAVALMPSCRTATELTLDIRTNLPCDQLSGVALVVRHDQAAAEDAVKAHAVDTSTHACSGAEIGTLVLTPGSDSGVVVVLAGVGGKDPATCSSVDGYAGCIVSRRAFGFVKHTALSLPVVLDRACVGVACDPASTCAAGACVNSNVVCDANGACAVPGEVVDGGVTPELDASVDAATATDAAIQEAGLVADAGIVNRLTGGDFETSCKAGGPWGTPPTVTLTSDRTAHTGNASCRVCGAGATFTIGQSSGGTLTPGTSYVGSAWVHVAAAATAATVASITVAATGTSDSAVSTVNLAAPATWQQIAAQLDITVPGSTTIKFQIDASGAGSCFLIDDAQLYRVK